MTRGEGAFFVKTAPSPLVLSPSPKKLSSGRAAGPRRWLAAGRKGHVWSWNREKEGGKLGREDAGVFSFSRSCLLPGRWHTSGSMGRGLTTIRREISLISLAAGTPQGGTLSVQRNVLCECREVKACLGIPGSDAGGTRGAARRLLPHGRPGAAGRGWPV